MEVLKALKFLVLAVSVFMFVYQCSTAVQKLMEKPVLDWTEYIPIQNITKPIITICPKQGLNHKRPLLRSFGYKYEHFLFKGENMQNKSLYSWNGWNDSLAFMDIVTSALAFDPNYDLRISTKAKQVYYARARFGLCYEIEGNFYKHQISRINTFFCEKSTFEGS